MLLYQPPMPIVDTTDSTKALDVLLARLALAEGDGHEMRIRLMLCNNSERLSSVMRTRISAYLDTLQTLVAAARAAAAAIGDLTCVRDDKSGESACLQERALASALDRALGVDHL